MGHPVNAGCRLVRQPRKGLAQKVDRDVVQQRGEPLVLPLSRRSPYTLKRLGHAGPALGPGHALLDRVSLGPLPSLHRLRRRNLGFVRRLPRYYGGVRLLPSVHHRLRPPAFPMRTASTQARRPGERPPGSRTKSVHACRGLRPRRARQALALARPSVLPSALSTTSAPEAKMLSRLNGRPPCSPVNASPTPSRGPTHDSAPVWVASPSP